MDASEELQGELSPKEERLNTGQQKIKGYRDLTPRELELVNKIKEAGATLEALVTEVEEHYNEVIALPEPQPQDHHERIADGLRWHEEAEKTLRIGIMLLVRSVTTPKGF